MRTSSRNALGKGISALITPADSERPDYFLTPIDRIRAASEQPRKDFDEEGLAELAASIESDGLLQPILVRRDGGDYVIIAGERRWRAARIAGLEEVPVVLRETSADEAFALALVENLQREDLGPLEVAEACRRLIDEFGLTQEAVAQRLGKSRSAIANTLRLLKLDPHAQRALVEGRVTEGHARQLVGLPEDDVRDVLQQIEENSLSVRETEARVREHKQPPEPAPAPVAPIAPRTAVDAVPVDPEIANAAARLERHLGTRVRISDKGGHGRVEIRFDSYEILEGVIEAILGEAL